MDKYYRRFLRDKLETSTAQGKLTTDDYCRILEFYERNTMSIPPGMLEDLQKIVRLKRLDFSLDPEEEEEDRRCNVEITEWPFCKEMCLKFAPSQPVSWQYWNELDDKCLFEYTIGQPSKLEIKRPVIWNQDDLYVEVHQLGVALKDDFNKMWGKTLRNTNLPLPVSRFKVKSVALLNNSSTETVFIHFRNKDGKVVVLEVAPSSVMFVESMESTWIGNIAGNRTECVVWGHYD